MASISLVRVFRNILIPSVRVTLEIRHGNGNKPKGKNTRKEENRIKQLQVAPPGFEPALQLPPVQNVKPRTTGPCDKCHSHCLNLWRSIYHDFKDTIDEKLLKQVFPSHFALFPCLFILGLYKGRSMNALVFFRRTR